MEQQSKFLTAKLKKFFQVMDINGDGVVTKEDFVEMGKRFAAASSVDEKKKEEIRHHFLQIWEDVFQKDSKVVEVGKPAFIDLLIRHGTDGRRKNSETVAPVMFHAIDADGDGLIQSAEFRNFFALFKSNDSDSDATFKIIDTNSDGVLSKDEFCGAFTEFLSGEDETSPFRLFFGPLDQ